MSDWTGSKLDELPPAVVGDLDDDTLLYIVSDPSGSPADKSLALSVLQERLSATFPKVTNVVAFGATGDGVTDDTAAFEAAEAEAGEGGVVYVPEGVFVVSWRIKTENLTVRGGPNATLMTPPGAEPLVNDCPIRVLRDGVTIENLTIDGNQPNNPDIDDFSIGAHADGIGIYANNVTVRGCRISNTIGHGIIVWNEAFDDVANSGRHGVIITENHVIGGTQRAAIDIASTTNPLTQTCYGCIISNNVYERQPIVVHTGREHTVIGNVSRGPNAAGISVHSNSRGVQIIGNTCERITNEESIGCAIVSNTVNSQTSEPGIKITNGCADTLVANNIIIGGAQDGIHLLDSDRVRVTGNILHAPTRYGVYIDAACTDVSLFGNNVYGSGNHAIHSPGADKVHVAGNVLLDAGFYGVSCASSCDNWRIEGNVIRRSSNSAIQLQGSGHLCDRNEIDTPGSFGIRISGSNMIVRANRFMGMGSTACIDFTNEQTGAVIVENFFEGANPISDLDASAVVRRNYGYAPNDPDFEALA